MIDPTSLPSARAASDLTDEDLVRYVLAGEKRLFELLIRRNNQRLYRALRSVVSDEAAVEEAMQQTYVLAYQQLAQFAGQARFSTWLIRIGLNEGLQQLRRSRKWELLEGKMATENEPMTTSANDDPEKQARAREAVRLLEDLLQALPEIYRLALVLKEVEGLSMRESAEAMGISEETARQRVSRARQMLRKNMEQRTGEQMKEAFQFEARRCDRVAAAVAAALPQDE